MDTTNPSNKEEEFNHIGITPDILVMANASKVTVGHWMERYEVDGKRIGVKIGGRWRINVERLKSFLKDEKVTPILR